MIIKKELLLGIFALMFLVSFVSAVCVVPTDGMIIIEDTTFCEGEYFFPNGISIGADNVVLDFNGAVLNGNGFGVGVYLPNYRDNATVKNGEIYNFRTGIYSHWSDNHEIRNMTLNSNVNSGISFLTSKNSIIQDNIINFNNESVFGSGIRLSQWSNNNQIRNNIINSNAFFGIGFSLSDNNSIINNTINSNKADGIWLHTSSNNKLQDNKLQDCCTVFVNCACIRLLYDSQNNTIEDTLINETPNDYGILFSTSESSNNVIFNNVILNTLEAIRLFSADNKIEYNNLYGNLDYNFHNHQSENITAKYNWWGTTEISEIKNKIYDYEDDSSRGKVDYIPFLCEPSPTNFISDENGQCVFDEDNDGVPNDEDKCPDTEEEQIVYGCSCEQILELKHGENKKSFCSPGIIKVFTEGICWAKDLF